MIHELHEGSESVCHYQRGPGERKITRSPVWSLYWAAIKYSKLDKWGKDRQETDSWASSTILTSRECPSRLINSWANVTSVETVASSFRESQRTPESELWMPLYRSSAQRPWQTQGYKSMRKQTWLLLGTVVVYILILKQSLSEEMCLDTLR